MNTTRFTNTYNRNFWKPRTLLIMWLILTLALASCKSGSGAPSSQPSATPTTAFTSTPVPTSTPTPLPTATPTPKLPVAPGTQMPAVSAAITAGNLEQVIEIARWGKGVISDVTYSPDGKTVAAASSLGISIRQADTLEEISFIDSEGIYIYSVDFSRDGKYIAAGLADKTARIWNISDGSLVQTFKGHTDYVRSVAFSPDGTMLVTGSSDKTANVWNVADGSVVMTVKGHALGINVVLFSPDGQSVFTGSADGTVRKTRIADGTMEHAYGANWIYDMALSADGTILAVYNNGLYNFNGNGEIIIWQVDNGKKLMTIKGGNRYSNDIRTLALSPDGKYVAAGWRDYTVKIWPVATGEIKNELEDLQPEGIFYYGYFTVAFSPDSQMITMAGRNLIGTWNVANGALLKQAETNSESVRGIALSPDGTTLASTEGTFVFLRTLLDGGSIPSQDEIEGTGDIAFSPDGNSIAVGLWEQDAKIWPVNDKGVRQSFETEAKEFAVRGVAFSPDGQLIALAISPFIELRQVSDGALVRTINTGDSTFRSVTDLAFSSDGTMIASAIYGSVKVFRVEDGKLIKNYNQAGSYLSFSPDNALIATGSDKGLVQVWKIGEDAPLLKIEEPVEGDEEAEGVSRLTFSPDGAMIVAGYYDGTIRVWNASDGALLRTWKPHADSITGIVFNMDGALMITSSFDGTIRFWGLKP